MKHQILRRTGALVLALVLAMTLTVPAWADDVPVTGITLNKNTLSLVEGDEEVLTATVAPDNATDQTVKWTSSDTKVAAVEDGRVTAVAVGTAVIEAAAQDGSGVTAYCTVTVTAAPSPFQFTTGDEVRTYADRDTWELAATVTGDTANSTITWTVSRKSDSDETNLPELSGTGTDGKAVTGTSVTTDAAAGTSVTITSKGAGDFIVEATYTTADGRKYTDTKSVTISGIVLVPVPSRELDDDETLSMFLNDNRTLSVKTYGLASTSDKVTWLSSDGTIVAVMNGSLTSYNKLGTAIITATKGNYSADCTVKVEEDASIVADEGYTATASRPLNIGETVYARLNKISEAKTAQYGEYADKDKEIGYGLKYITNLKVSTLQGDLFYNYVSEGNPGKGTGTADCFAKTTAGTTYYSLDKLFFVPKPGFVGMAEITFNAVAKNNRNFAGTIKVNVGMGSGGSDPDGDDGGKIDEYTYEISYRARAGEPVWFMRSDFNAFCQSATGRNFNSITFSLPKVSEGTLYSNYAAGTGTPVTTDTKFTQSGVYTIDEVCFVPNAAYDGKDVTINFRAVDSAGEMRDGKVTVTVIPVDVDGEPSNVSVVGVQGQPVTLQAGPFYDACQDTIKDTLSFVVFKLPNPSEGVLYYNYKSDGSFESRVTEAARYYYSGVPGLNNVTFVPGSGASGRIAIPYTGYGSGGTTYTGTLYISLDGVNSSTIRYSVPKNGSVNFRASDFYNAGLYQTGTGVDHVRFDLDEVNDTLGTLYYDYKSSDRYHDTVGYGYYYVSPNSRYYEDGLSRISFHAENSTGTVTVPYTAYDSRGNRLFDGRVVIQVVGSTPADVSVSCNTGWYAQLSAYSLGSACDAVMSKSLSYIEITGVPASEQGHLYLSYNGFGTGTAVKPGDRFYYLGSPGIDRLFFVPRAGFTGEVEITYIGYSGDGLEQVSGHVLVNVSRSTFSRYFNDMGGHAWAIDSVDYLRWNGTVKGVGGGSFAPTMTLSKGDFTLMLVRAYGLTASGSVSFNDVPADSYYADAIRVAALLGIAGGSNGYFYPTSALSRQDAAVMIYNTLKASGKDTTNGLAANLDGYHDEGQISPYAREAMGSLVQMGILNGTGNGYLEPLRNLTRAEAAKLLHSIMTL